MKDFWIIGIIWIICGKISSGQREDLSLPKGFAIGAGSAAYQIEGAWNVGGKSESIWDRWAHDHPNYIADGSNGDIAADFYHKYKEDVQHMKSIGLKFFRFSIAWSRVLPNGFGNEIGKDGIKFYKNLVAELLANGIEPVVTLYHWDHPQVLEDMGGWTNELMVDWFVSFARIMFKELGSSVKIWTTINEPNVYCSYAYESANHLAPGKNLTGVGKYLCVHNMLKAHAKTYRMYGKEFRSSQKGQLGIIPNCQAYIPYNSSYIDSAEIAFQFACGWILNPIYHGDYPRVMKSRIAMISKEQGYEKSRLPTFSKEWISYIKGTADYLGLNHYSSNLVYPDPEAELGIHNNDNGLLKTVDSSWHATFISSLYVNPPGFGEILRQFRDRYDNPPVRVMENGYSNDGNLKDNDRIQFHHDYLVELLKAVKRDGCNVKSYSVWALLDDYEWVAGYVAKFGILSVDFSNANRTRTLRSSASWWKNVLKTRKLQPVPE